MKIYLLWTAYGQDETYTENLMGCYLERGKALERQRELEKINKHRERCKNCLAHNTNNFEEDDIDCEDLAFRKDKFNGFWCENDCAGLFEDMRYWVEEMAVIE